MNLTELERLAKAATPGPWIQDGQGCLPWEVSPASLEACGARIVLNPTKAREDHMGCVADAKYIALANPATILALIARVRELEAGVPTWQPIETAPKDGEEFLCYSEDAGQFIAAWTDGLDGELLLTQSGDDITDDLPTHWMPLPPPPTGANP